MGMAIVVKRGPKCDINVTPLIDVLLVLLIIFMVITPLDSERIGRAGAAAAAAEPPKNQSNDRTIVVQVIDQRTWADSGTQDQSGRRQLGRFAGAADGYFQDSRRKGHVRKGG